MAFFCKLYYVGNCETNCLLKVSESQDIALFVVSGSIKKIFSIDCVKIYFPQSIVNYLFSIMFSIDLKMWGYTTLIISWLINFNPFMHNVAKWVNML